MMKWQPFGTSVLRKAARWLKRLLPEISRPLGSIMAACLTGTIPAKHKVAITCAELFRSKTFGCHTALKKKGPVNRPGLSVSNNQAALSKPDYIFFARSFNNVPGTFETRLNNKTIACFKRTCLAALFRQNRVACQNMAKLPFVIFYAPFSG